jgi:hypothetical protein
MDNLITIHQLKQLPRVGQADDRFKDKSSTNAPGSSPLSSALEIGVITAASKLVTELNAQISGLNNLLAVTIKPIEDLNAAFGITSQMSQQIFKLNQDTYKTLLDQNIANSTILKQQRQLNSILPGQVSNLVRATGASSNLVKSQTELVELGKINEAAAAQFNRFIFASGRDTETVNKNLVRTARTIEIATGETGVFRDMLNAVGTLAAGTRQEFRGTAEELAQSALNATRVGTTLDEVRTSAKGYLNIEQSIQDELEAQLLTGKNLAGEMNQLRVAAYTGDFDEVLRIQNKLIQENFEEIQKKGPRALEAFAKSINLSTDQVATQFETAKARNQIIKDAAPLTLKDLQQQKNLTEQQKEALQALEAAAKAKGEFGDTPLVQDILNDPTLKQAIELVFPMDQIQDLRTQTDLVQETLTSTTDALASVYSDETFIGLRQSIDTLATTISKAAIGAATGNTGINNIEDVFNKITGIFTSDNFKQKMTDAFKQSAKEGTAAGLAEAISAKAPQIGQEYSNRNAGIK